MRRGLPHDGPGFAVNKKKIRLLIIMACRGPNKEDGEWLFIPVIEWFYLTRETNTNNYCKIATSKQKKTMELVHNSA